ncbi:hypothetical protein AK830_g7317 [Neonectria ditissima]|uniref:Uncharacterized protein n=1 Tax=Neonectria ditissima TaxID=78410 RepID=A0A0P7AXD7_9HYPO|nr:hypothetical protein AK830_g7317 [Neonectria ditissima]
MSNPRHTQYHTHVVPPKDREPITPTMSNTRAAPRRGETEAPSVAKNEEPLYRNRATEAFSDAFEEGVKKARLHFKENVPKITREEFLAPDKPGCPVPVFDRLWSESDEDALQRRWNASHIKFVIENLSNSDAQFHAVWKVSLRLLQTDPFSLLNSEFTVSTADNSLVSWQGRMVPSPLWPGTFSEALSRLMTHPFFSCRNTGEKLRFYLKWAVVCRTDDRRPFQSEDFTACPVVRKLIRTQSPGDQSWWEYHETLQEAAWGHFGDALLESRLLGAIAKLVKKPQQAQTPSPTARYEIFTKDLNQVMKAIDTVSTYGVPVMVNTTAAFDCFRAARGGPTYPCGVEELREAVADCWLTDQRRNRRRIRHLRERLAGLENDSFEREGPNEGNGRKDQLEDHVGHGVPVQDESDHPGDVPGEGRDVIPSGQRAVQPPDEGINTGPKCGIIGALSGPSKRQCTKAPTPSGVFLGEQPKLPGGVEDARSGAELEPPAANGLALKSPWSAQLASHSDRWLRQLLQHQARLEASGSSESRS